MTPHTSVTGYGEAKASHTLGIGHKDIKLVVNWNSSPCWLMFTVLEGAVQATGGGNSSLVSNLLQYFQASVFTGALEAGLYWC